MQKFEGSGTALLERHQPPNGLLRFVTASQERPETRSTNAILQAIPVELWLKWQPSLKRVLLHEDQVLIEREQPTNYVYFVERGLVSLVTCLDSGSQAEAATVGSEGIAGGHLCYDQKSFCRVVVQIPGKALRLPMQMFMEDCINNPLLKSIVWRYHGFLMNQASQLLLCNRAHTLRARLSSWLLAVHEATGHDELEVTHSAIAKLLGSRRSGVTVALGELQAAGLVVINRSQISLVDCDKMKSHACECYPVHTREIKKWRDSLPSGSM